MLSDGQRHDDRRQAEERDGGAVRQADDDADRKTGASDHDEQRQAGVQAKNETSPAIASTGPTERSTPPVMMTKVVQVAMMPIERHLPDDAERLSGLSGMPAGRARTRSR